MSRQIITGGGTGGGGGGGTPTGYPALPGADGTYNLNITSGIASWQPVGGYVITGFGISGTGVAGIVEVGSTQAAVNWSASYNFTPTAITLSWSGIASGSTPVTPTGGSSSGTITGPFTSSNNGDALVVSIAATDPAGAPHSAAVAMTYAGKIVFGSLPSGSQTADQSMWNALNTAGNVLAVNRGGAYSFASPAGQDQCFGILSSLGTPAFTDPSTGFGYPPTQIGSTASITENGTTQSVNFWKAGLPGATITLDMS